MDKLELKYLAPYLPYGLNIWSYYNNRVETLTGFIDNETARTGIRPNIIWDTNLKEIKPILRPLSDIREQIEVDGVKIRPVEMIVSNACYYANSTMLKNPFGHSFDVKSLPFDRIQILLKLHFDIFGLIDAGIAISYKEAGL